MAITIYQYPNQVNQANSDLIWVVSSSFTTSSQYQYICTLKDGCGNDLTTIKQQPNPSGKGVFDLGRLAIQYLGFTTTQSMWNAGENSIYYKPLESGKYFKVAFGEQYATSSTGIPRVYNGIVNNVTGSPAQSGSIPYYFWLNGTVDPNSGYWNWNTSSYYVPKTTPSSTTFKENICLTEAPRTQSCQITDYMTLWFLNGNISGSSTTAQDVYGVELTVYDDTNTVVYNTIEYNIGGSDLNSGGPRNNINQLWSAVSSVNPCTTTASLLSIGIGPENLTLRGGFDFRTDSWTYYTIKLLGQEAAATPNTNGVWDEFTIYKQEINCGYEGVRFVFWNNVGAWDYFNFTLENSKTTTMDRSTYKQSFVDYSTPTTSVPYNKQRRGQTTYNIDLEEIYTSNSDWLTQEQSDWLEQLFYSPNVYIQDGIEMVPVVIDNVSVTSRTNPRSQKMFNYTITYRLANSKRSR